jgi:hypothetical protein
MTQPTVDPTPEFKAEPVKNDPAPTTVDTGAKFTQADIDRIVTERVRKEQAKFTDYGDLKKKAAEFDKAAEAQKSEAQKLADKLAEAEKSVAARDTALSRMIAATTHGIPVDLIDMLGVGSPEEIDARAKLLAEKLAPAVPGTPQPNAIPGRPVESLRPGAAPGDGGLNKDDPNAWLRHLAGR